MKTALPLLLLCSTVAFARVGEKYEDFVKRVGKAERIESAAKGSTVRYEHKFNGITITAIVEGGLIRHEDYMPVTLEQAVELVSRQKEGRFEKVREGRGVVEWLTPENDSAHYSIESKKLNFLDKSIKDVVIPKVIEGVSEEIKKLDGL
jgi:hypothetical protein